MQHDQDVLALLCSHIVIQPAQHADVAALVVADGVHRRRLEILVLHARRHALGIRVVVAPQDLHAVLEQHVQCVLDMQRLLAIEIPALHHRKHAGHGFSGGGAAGGDIGQADHVFLRQ